MAEKIKESELYEPIYDYFTKLGYTVKSEINDCDIMGVKDAEVIIIETKATFNLKLIYQGIDRQMITKDVFLGIPRPAEGQKNSSFRNMVKLVKRLDLGLLTVAVDSPTKAVDIIVYPEAEKKRGTKKRLEKTVDEFTSRSGDYNTGGTSRKKILTSYRERAIEMACIAEKYGELPISMLKEFGFGSREAAIFSRNYYDWFEKVEKGVYHLSSKGIETLENGEFKNVVNLYREKYKSEE